MTRTKPTMGASMVGHILGFGVNAILYAIGVFGWGVAAIIGGLFTVTTIGSAVLRRKGKLGLSRHTRGTGGLLSRARGRGTAGRGGSVGGANGRRGLLGRLGGGRRGTSRSGHTSGGGGRGGLLGKLTKGRSLSPKRGAGIPGRGSSTARSLNPLSRGRRPNGAGAGRPMVPGGGRRSTASSATGTRKTRGSGPPGGSGSKLGALGGRSKTRTPGSRGPGSRGAGRSGGSRPGAGSKGGKLRSIGGTLNPFKRRRTSPTTPGSRGTGRTRIGRGKAAGTRPFTNPFTKLRGRSGKPQTKKQRANNTPQSTPKTPTGSEPATQVKIRKEHEMPKHGIGRNAPHPATIPTGTATGRAGSVTAAAEQLAGAMAKPGQPIDTLKGMDANLGDIAGGLSVLAGGLKNAANAQLEAMPDEIAAHERMMQLSKQMQQISQEAELIQADQKRRNAMDHERIDNARRNERGYDFQANQQ